jgi:enoyl-CoA hydratase/carnithine racemase
VTGGGQALLLALNFRVRLPAVEDALLERHLAIAPGLLPVAAVMSTRIGRGVLGELEAGIEPDVDLRVVERTRLTQLIIDGAPVLDRDADFRVGRDHQSDRLLQGHGG